MATTYDDIAKNKRKSLALVIFFMVIVAFIGWAIGVATNYGTGGLVLAILIAIIMTYIGFYAGDRVALSTSGAQGPIRKEQNEYLYRLIENLCIADGIPVPKVYIIPDPTINAFATGRDPKHASIAVTQGAIENLENEELEGVLAHELSHVKNFDTRYLMLVLMLVNIVTLLARWFFYSGRFGSRRSDDRNSGAGILAIIGIVLLILSPIIGQLIQFAVSRRREFLADASGALLTRYPAGLAGALEKIRVANVRPMQMANDATAHLFFANPFGSGAKRISRLFMTHPPIEERITALRRMDSTG